MKPSGIGGQAVIEGIMMRNKDKYSIAVRKPDNEIEVVVRESRLITEKHPWLNLPIIRGIVNFIDSLVTGISTINYSASFYDDPAEQEKTKLDEAGKNLLKDKFESVLMAVTVILSIFFAIGLFMVLPYLATKLVSKYIVSKTLLHTLGSTLKQFISSRMSQGIIHWLKPIYIHGHIHIYRISRQLPDIIYICAPVITFCELICIRPSYQLLLPFLIFIYVSGGKYDF